MKSIVYTCQCGETRKQTNHWFLIKPLSNGKIVCMPWIDKIASQKGIEHICGRECLTKYIAKWTGAIARFPDSEENNGN